MGFEDESWCSRTAQPSCHSWTDDEPLRLVEQAVARDDPDPHALAFYGVIVRRPAQPEQTLLRCVDGRPVSAVTTQFLEWACADLALQGVRVLALVWDNASWHISKAVRSWIRAHNQQVKRTGVGVRLLVCALPIKSPWLNPIEPHWVHAKKRIVEPARLLAAPEVADRLCAAFDAPHLPHLSVPEKAA